MDYSQIVKVYLKIRDKRADLKKAFDTSDNELKAKQEQLEGTMLDFLNTSGVDSTRTEAGTFFKQEDLIPTGSDWAAFYDWIKEHDAFDALERRVKKVFISNYLEENDGAVPPGISIFRQYKVRVRRPS